MQLFVTLKNTQKLWIYWHPIISKRDHVIIFRQQKDSDQNFQTKKSRKKKHERKGGKRTLKAPAWIFVIVRRCLAKLLQIIRPIYKLKILPCFIHGSLQRFEPLNFLLIKQRMNFASKTKLQRKIKVLNKNWKGKEHMALLGTGKVSRGVSRTQRWAPPRPRPPLLPPPNPLPDISSPSSSFAN